MPVIAAGGVCDGRSMAAAFVLGAEGVQMGTRMVSAAESPVHDNWKQLICDSTEGDTLLLNRANPPAFRVLRTSFSERAEQQDGPVIPNLEDVLDLYFDGNLDASFAFGGQVAGRIDEVKPVAADPRRDDGRVRRRHPRGRDPLRSGVSSPPERGGTHATSGPRRLLGCGRESRQEGTWRRRARFSGTRSSGERTRGSSSGDASTSTTSRSTGCCTSRSSGRRSRTRAIEMRSTSTRRGTMPGVVAVYTAGDLDAARPPRLRDAAADDEPAAARRGKVRFVGDIVAMVVAETKAQAVDAAEAVIVDYDPLPAVVDIEAALEPDAPIVHEEHGSNVANAMGTGPVEGILDDADVVVSQRIVNQRARRGADGAERHRRRARAIRRRHDAVGRRRRARTACATRSRRCSASSPTLLRGATAAVGGGFGAEDGHVRRVPARRRRRRSCSAGR